MGLLSKRISRIFQSKSSIQEECNKKEKKRWTFTTKRESKDWFNPIMIYNQEQEHFDDEKVEIIVPSDSMNSFLSTTTKTSTHMPSFYYSIPDMTIESQKMIEEEEVITPRTSIESIQKPSLGLATMAQDILGDAFSIADQEFFSQSSY